MSLNLYVWLAWRLHTLARLTPISWPALHAQFGGGFKNLRHFRPSFEEALAASMAAYPQARVDLPETGIALHPSRPPIAKRAIVSALLPQADEERLILKLLAAPIATNDACGAARWWPRFAPTTYQARRSSRPKC